jgi:hypothetical protein
MIKNKGIGEVPVNVVQSFDCPRQQETRDSFMPLRIQPKSDPVRVRVGSINRIGCLLIDGM